MLTASYCTDALPIWRGVLRWLGQFTWEVTSPPLHPFSPTRCPWLSGLMEKPAVVSMFWGLLPSRWTSPEDTSFLAQQLPPFSTLLLLLPMGFPEELFQWTLCTSIFASGYSSRKAELRYLPWTWGHSWLSNSSAHAYTHTSLYQRHPTLGAAGHLQCCTVKWFPQRKGGQKDTQHVSPTCFPPRGAEPKFPSNQRSPIQSLCAKLEKANPQRWSPHHCGHSLVNRQQLSFCASCPGSSVQNQPAG